MIEITEDRLPDRIVETNQERDKLIKSGKDNMADIRFEETIRTAQGTPITLEQLYQEFKQRLIKEVFVQSNELLDYADLIDLEDN